MHGLGVQREIFPEDGIESVPSMTGLNLSCFPISGYQKLHWADPVENTSYNDLITKKFFLFYFNFNFFKKWTQGRR